jgi:hypothetical protein
LEGPDFGLTIGPENRRGFMAVAPVDSNHQSGVAVDVDDYEFWLPYFANAGVRWLPCDVMHFESSNAADGVAFDIGTFQRLYNHNHQGQKQLPVNGEWDYTT